MRGRWVDIEPVGILARRDKQPGAAADIKHRIAQRERNPAHVLINQHYPLVVDRLCKRLFYIFPFTTLKIIPVIFDPRTHVALIGHATVGNIQNPHPAEIKPFNEPVH